jgi:hypothetical protein
MLAPLASSVKQAMNCRGDGNDGVEHNPDRRNSTFVNRNLGDGGPSWACTIMAGALMITVCLAG